MKLAILLLATTSFYGVSGDHDAPRLAGIRLEMSKDQVHRVLNRVAVYKSQDENQEVWSFTHDDSLSSVIVGFAHDNRVRYITTLARADGGSPLKCAPLNNPRDSKITGTPPDTVYTRSWTEHEESFVAIAHGTPDHFTSCSVKKVGSGIEND